jgi:tetratricopeptide (TPR) repeat protein
LNEDYAKARAYLGKAASLKSSDRDVLYYLGMSYQREFFLDSALFYLKRADLLHPLDREVNEALYPIAAQLKEWDLAARAIMVLVQTGDPIEQYRERLADLNVKMGNNIIAFVHARELLKTDSLNPDRYYQLSVLAFKIDSFQVAEDVVDRAIDKFGPNPAFLSSKGMLLTQKSEYAEAEKIFRPLLEADSSVINKYRLASALIDQSARTKKEEAYRLYSDIKDVVGPELKVDSLLMSLDSILNP